jgi:hypothetical protein
MTIGSLDIFPKNQQTSNINNLTGYPLTVQNGGTGSTSFTPYSVIVEGPTSTSPLTSVQLGPGQVLIGTSTSPIANNLMAGPGIGIAEGEGTITISATSSSSAMYDGNTGTAIPAGGILNIIGGPGSNITTTGSSNNLTITIVGAWSPEYGGTGVSDPPAHTIPIAEGSSNFNFLALTNGQILIGSTSADPVPATLTAGTGVNITNAAGSITINSTGGGLTWVDVISTGATMTPNTGYIADNAALVTLQLPPTVPQGSVFRVAGKGAGKWQITESAGQSINYGIATTTTTTGSLAATNQYDAVELLCVTANTQFIVLSSIGNLTAN